MFPPLSKEMSELREWIIEHGVDVRKLREEARDKGVVDNGDYLHWLEREVVLLREALTTYGMECMRSKPWFSILYEPRLPIPVERSSSPLSDGNEETQP